MRLQITTPGREFEQSIGDGKTSAVIGNRALDDITIENDPGVSGPHVRIEKFAGKWSFTDQFSAGGTIHNGEKKYNGDLKVGDVLRIGATEVRVLSLDGVAGQPGEAAAPKESSSGYAPQRSARESLSDVPELRDGYEVDAGGLSDELKAALAAAAPERVQLIVRLTTALYEAAKRQDFVTYSDDDEQQAYCRNLGVIAGLKAPMERVQDIWIPLLKGDHVRVYDVEADMNDELDGDISDLDGMTREIYELVSDTIRNELGFDVGSDSLAVERLADAASECADEFESGDRHEMRLYYLTTGPGHFGTVVLKRDGKPLLGDRLPPPELPPGQASPEESELAEVLVQKLRDQLHDEPSSSIKEEIREMAARFVGEPGREATAKAMADILMGGSHGVPADMVQAVHWADIDEDQRPMFVMLARYLSEHYGLDLSNNYFASVNLGRGVRSADEELKKSGATQAKITLFQALGDDNLPTLIRLMATRDRVISDDTLGLKRPEPPSTLTTQEEDALRKNRELTRRMVVLVAVSIGVVVALSIIFDGLFDSVGEEPSIVTAEEEAPEDDEGAAELELQKKVQALMQSDTPPQDLLDQLDDYEHQARTLGYHIGWDYERCRTHLETRVHRDVSQRYNEVAGTLFKLTQANHYRQAEKNVNDLRLYLARSPRNERATKALELDETVERWSETHRVKSKAFVAEQILIIQEAVSREDFAPAVEALGRVNEGALLDQPVITACEELQASFNGREGEIRKPFHYRDRPPKSPQNELLPKGDSTGYSRLNAHQNKVVEALRGGEVREFEVWGLNVIAEGEQRTSQLTMTYILNLGQDVRLEGVQTSNLSNLPDAVRLALLMRDEQLSSDALTGMLVFAFDNGLFDEAAEIAYHLRRIDPEKKTELDEILSVKWGAPVPEGGFPENDGRVVRD